MPSYTMKNGVRRWLGQVWQDGKVIKRKWFGNNPKPGGPDHKAALKWEEATKAEMLTPSASGEEPPSRWTPPTPSLNEWATAFLSDSQARRAPATFKEHKTALTRFGAFFTDRSEPVTILTRPAVLRFMQHVQLAAGNNAANKVRKVMASAWTWAAKFVEGFPQEANPFLAVPRYAPVRKPRKLTTQEDFDRVLALTEGQDRAMLITLLHTGARRGEVFRLTWADVDFIQSRICLRTRKTADGSWREDWLPMTSTLRQALMDHRQSRIHRHSDYVFVVEGGHRFENQHEGNPFTSRQHWLKKLCAKAEVAPFDIHSIRHLSASVLYAAGQPVSVIQAVLRHESPQTTTRYLKSLGLEDTRAALESAFSSTRGKVIPMNQKKEATG